MRPDVLDNLGLFAALKWQANQFQERTGIECRVVCSGEHDCVNCKNCTASLDQKQEINLFRIFQEALTNVVRHSKASRVDAEFRPGSDEVVLSIRDNGCGLPEGKKILPTSYGMRGMRERVGQMAGKIEFDSPPGEGLHVIVRLPQSGKPGE
jgi:signal transduction histidine kinase